MKTTISAALISLAALTACGDDGPTGPVGAGTFEMEVTGAVTASVEGIAWFGLQSSGGTQIFTLLLTNASQDHSVIAGFEGATRPPAGTYDISAEAWELIYLYSQNNELLATFFALDGDVTITESEPRRLRGTITFSGAGTLDGAEQEVSGTITFDARPAS